jgi:pSer/pThr/pTyr-binding forkhead associated (FHA) protein
MPTRNIPPDFIASLSVVTGPCPRRDTPIPAAGLVIGRGADVDLDLAEDNSVSRQHARLVRHPDGTLSVTDSGSANGTYVNAVRVEAPRQVVSQDIIRVGATELLVRLSPAPAASAAQTRELASLRAPGAAGMPVTDAMPVTDGIPVTDNRDGWPEQLAGRLFALPPRWGWQAPADALPAAQSTAPSSPRPVWIEPPSPDTSALYAARSKAVSKVIRRLAFIVIAAVAFASAWSPLKTKLSQQGSSAHRIFWVVLIVIVILLAVGLLRAFAAVRRATRAIRSFERPYHTLRDAERQRHEQALHDWDEAVRLSQEEAAEAARLAAEKASGPQWFPVGPQADPARVDVLGGDPWRHGWASLLVTFGASVLAAGHRITLLDFSGQDVGGGLASVARARGLTTIRVDLGEGSGVNLLDGVPAGNVAEALAYALTGQPEANGDYRHERALATEMLKRILDSLDDGVTFGRLAAGLRVLRQGSGEELLTDAEVSRLAARIGDVDQNEWTSRQLRFLASQLDVLQAIAPVTGQAGPLWTHQALTLITTPGGRDDRKELLDRLLVQTVQRAMHTGDRLSGFLVLAGADQLGAQSLAILSDHSRRAGVRLMLMIDQPQGDLEKTVGTGGAVCIMKMYNHRDAAIAAELVGKGYKFVVNQVTRQAGKTFTDSGGDSFGANTGKSDGGKKGLFASSSVSDSRGHVWTGTRTWSSADNISTSTGSGRVYEFIVDPQEILGMPETAFILVDSSGQSRRVAMVDANPGISLLDRVAVSPA